MSGLNSGYDKQPLDDIDLKLALASAIMEAIMEENTPLSGIHHFEASIANSCRHIHVVAWKAQPEPKDMEVSEHHFQTAAV